MYKKWRPEDDIDTLKYVGILYDTDIAVNILCICWFKLLIIHNARYACTVHQDAGRGVLLNDVLVVKVICL